MSNARTIVFSAPQGWGKNLKAKQLRNEFGCSHVVDWEDMPWPPQIVPGALHLTSLAPDHLRRLGLAVGATIVARGWANVRTGQGAR